MSYSEQVNSETEEEKLPTQNIWYLKDYDKWLKTTAIRGRTPAYNMVTVLSRLAALNNRPEKPVDAPCLLFPLMR